MKSIIAAAAAALAFTSVAASAQDGEEQAGEPEKKICRTEKTTGSLTRRTRICMTEAEWRQLHDRTRKGLQEMGQAASGGANSSWKPNSVSGR